MNSKDYLPKLMTAKDIMKHLQISRGKAYQLFQLKDFPTIILGGNKRVDRDEFLRWVESRKTSSMKG